MIKSAFFRRTAVLASGTALGQTVVILASPILSRLYSPEEFGVLGVFSGILAPLSIVAALRYEQAIMLPEENSPDAENLLVLSVLVCLGVGLFVLICWIAAGSQVAKALGVDEYQGWFFLLPVVVALSGIFMSLRIWALRSRMFGVVTASIVSQNCVHTGVQLSAGFIKALSAEGLLLGHLVGRIAAVIVVGWGSLRGLWKRLRKNISMQELARVGRRYRWFPQYQTGGALLGNVSRESVVLLIGYFFGKEVAGLYFFGYRLLNLPLMLVGSAVGDVYFVKGARETGSPGAANTLVQLARGLAMIAMPVALVTIVIAPWTFELFFGPEWHEAGVYVRILAVLFAIRLVVSPLSITFSIYEKQRQALFWQAGSLILTGISIFVGGYFESIYLALGLYALTGSIMYIVMLALCMRHCGAKFKDLFTL